MKVTTYSMYHLKICGQVHTITGSTLSIEEPGAHHWIWLTCKSTFIFNSLEKVHLSSLSFNWMEPARNDPDSGCLGHSRCQCLSVNSLQQLKPVPSATRLFPRYVQCFVLMMVKHSHIHMCLYVCVWKSPLTVLCMYIQLMNGCTSKKEGSETRVSEQFGSSNDEV